MTAPKFPQCIYLGEFHSPTYGNLPAYIPAIQGGFCLHYHNDEFNLACRQIENTVLCLLEDTPTGLLQVHIVDILSYELSFPFLAELQPLGIHYIYDNDNSALQCFNDLDLKIKNRYQKLFKIEDGNSIENYNARAKRPEPYFVLIINTKHFPKNNISDERLKNFLQKSYNAGVYVIALHDKNQEINDHDHALKSLLSGLPKIEFTNNFTEFNCDKNILPIHKMEQFGFRFRPSDINQTQIIKNINLALNKNSNNDSNFLHIKIGSLPNGDDAYLSLGQKSENYSALLLGVPGSGKSTFLSNIIMQIGINYDASQIRLYLMDFAGVEFNQFKNHPNVEKIFLEANSPQEGLSLLESLRNDVEIRRNLFASQNIKDIGVYNSKNKDYPLPRILIIIDEFHRLFERSGVFHNRDVNTILDEIIREWRKFGIHLFLCTPTLKDVGLNTSVKDLLGLRISYRVNNESALGAGIFDPKFNKSILTLDQYQALFQTKINNSYLALIDEPIDVDNTINQLRLTRPKHLQVWAETISRQAPTAKEVASQKTTNQTLQTETKIQTKEIKAHANRKRIDEIRARYQDKIFGQNNNDPTDGQVPDLLKNFIDRGN